MKRVDRRIQILALIEQHGPIGAMELSKMLGIQDNTITEYITAMKKKHLIHVSGWRPHPVNGCKAQLVSIGNGKNLKKPEPTRRLIDESESWTDRDIRRRMEMIADTKPFRHWQDIALFGPVQTNSCEAQ